jgi:hypothetical protein
MSRKMNQNTLKNGRINTLKPDTAFYCFRRQGGSATRPFRPALSIGPVKDPFANDVHEDGNAVDQADRQDFVEVRFHVDDEDENYIFL